MARAAADKVAQRLLALVPNSASVVAGYWSFRGELDVASALADLSKMGHTLCLPVIEAEDKPLYFRRWKPEEPLEMGRYGIGIPPAGAPVFKPDVLILPLVAFDRRGNRLGYGAGYYDRTLRRLREEKQVMAIGVGYSQQEAPSIPAGVMDERLDLIVTDRDVIRVEL